MFCRACRQVSEIRSLSRTVCYYLECKTTFTLVNARNIRVWRDRISALAGWEILIENLKRRCCVLNVFVTLVVSDHFRWVFFCCCCYWMAHNTREIDRCKNRYRVHRGKNGTWTWTFFFSVQCTCSEPFLKKIISVTSYYCWLCKYL